MNTLLIFFAFPVATIILATVLQTVLRSPIAVAATFFAIFLIITFAFYDANFLIATIVYTIIAFLSAALVNLIRKFIRRLCINNNANNDTNTGGDNAENVDNTESNLNCGNIGINCDYINGRENIYRFRRR